MRVFRVANTEGTSSFVSSKRLNGSSFAGFFNRGCHRPASGLLNVMSPAKIRTLPRRLHQIITNIIKVHFIYIFISNTTKSLIEKFAC